MLQAFSDEIKRHNIFPYVKYLISFNYTEVLLTLENHKI
ncbi:hypothetical protein C7434_3775 [Pantoea sp. PNA 14-12]|nr:hypothetical protein C7434_3775 [Pantoea sp. PNA 14-12]